MDRNSAIGLTMIAVMLLVYLLWFSPSSQPERKPVATQQAGKNNADSLRQHATANNNSIVDSSYTSLSSAQSETPVEIETEDLKVTFTNKGAIIRELELKKYKTYSQQPLKLITPERSKFHLTANYKGQPFDLYSPNLVYQSRQSKNGDTTLVSFSIVQEGLSLTHTYAIPPKGYEIRYSLQQKGFDQQVADQNLAFEWTDAILPLEKDLQDTRINTTVTYYDGDFDELDYRSTSTESETLSTPLKWASIKQKFFLSSIIADTQFAGGEVSTSLNPNDASIVKNAKVKLLVPKTSLANGVGFKYYVGPNDYQVISKVTENFAKNVYLGWPPVYWINKFVIFPVFHFLTQFITNYGLIIVILVILLKLVLFPLSYKSYLSMAKMKVLKPELDEIKERNGEDMTKIQQEQLKLYQQVGVNPISGCIPVLLQMPILFAMFYLFPASIELRQQPFLWAEDLSTYDSVITFPAFWPLGGHISLFTVLMTLATLVYTWQNNQLSSVTGPMKAMSYIMPVIFFFVLNSFSSGLTFYYFVSTLVTFGQQALIRRFVDDNKIKALLDENRKKIAAGGGGKKSRFMAKLEDAMKASEEARRKAEEEKRKRKK